MELDDQSLYAEKDETRSAWNGLNYLNRLFIDWAGENIKEEDVLWQEYPSEYEYTAFLDVGRSKEVIEAWKQAL